MNATQLLVLAKAPRPGRVKTRLCPPCTPGQAAAVAEAALADTLAAGRAAPSVRRTVVLSGTYPVPEDWHAVQQRGVGLGERLANAFLDTARPGVASLLIGMDTPQVRPDLLGAVASALDRADAVLAPAVDGGWWALALRDPAVAVVLCGVPMSRPDTGARTAEALVRLGLTVAEGPVLRDVDTAADAWMVARDVPLSRFGRAVRMHVPNGAAA
jgi:uncharacterized protein